MYATANGMGEIPRNGKLAELLMVTGCCGEARGFAAKCQAQIEMSAVCPI
jgi:hypothetical protein